MVTFSADVATLYREQKDPEKMENFEEELSGDFDENSGFAIIINGHSLVYCLSPELETRFGISFFSLIYLFSLIYFGIKLKCYTNHPQVHRSRVAM